MCVEEIGARAIDTADEATWPSADDIEYVLHLFSTLIWN